MHLGQTLYKMISTAWVFVVGVVLTQPTWQSEAWLTTTYSQRIYSPLRSERLECHEQTISSQRVRITTLFANGDSSLSPRSGRRLGRRKKEIDQSPFGRDGIEFGPHQHNIMYANKTREEKGFVALRFDSDVQRRRNIARRRRPDTDAWKRDRAVLALCTHLRMDLSEAYALVEAFPELYLDCPRLSTRLLFILEDLGYSRQKVVHLLRVHPRLIMNQILLNEQYDVAIASTIQILQSELGLTAKEILGTRGVELWTLERTAVRERIYLLRDILGEMSDSEDDTYDYSEEIKRIVLRYPTFLAQTEEGIEDETANMETNHGVDSRTIGQRGCTSKTILDVIAFLRYEAKMTNQQLKTLIMKYPMLFSATPYQLKRIEAQWDFIVKGPIGRGLGMVKRRGIDASASPSNSTETEEQREKIILERCHEFVIRYPVMLTTPKLVPMVKHLTVNYGCPVVDIGRMAYRRPKVFQYQLANLKRKVDFFLDGLGLEDKDNESGEQTGKGTKAVMSMLAVAPDIFTQSIDNNLQPKLEYFQELGFQKDQLQRIIVTRPQILSLSLNENLKKKFDYLLDVAKLPPDVVREMVACFPQILREPLDSRLQHRCEFFMEYFQIKNAADDNSMIKGTSDAPIPCPETVPLDFLYWTGRGFESWVRKNLESCFLREMKRPIRFPSNKATNTTSKAKKKAKSKQKAKKTVTKMKK